jgi:hypothetical protein
MTIHQSANGDSQGNPNLETFQELQVSLGKSDISSLILVSEVSVPASGGGSATGGGIVASIPLGSEIIDVRVIPIVASTDGTMQVKTGGEIPAAISDAIACAVDKTVGRAATIDDAYKYVSADGVKVFSHAEADAAKVYILYKRNL